MAAYTEHYQLHQWVPEDDFLRTDFNTDFAKIDAALGEKAGVEELAEVQALAGSKCRVVIGSYTGNGDSARVITLGFRPKVVAVDDTSSYSSGCELGLDGIDERSVTVVNVGFQVDASPQDLTESGTLYRYYAIG